MGLAESQDRRSKVMYAKSFDNNKNKSHCFDIDLDDLDYNEDEKLILCFDFG